MENCLFYRIEDNLRWNWNFMVWNNNSHLFMNSSVIRIILTISGLLKWPGLGAIHCKTYIMVYCWYILETQSQYTPRRALLSYGVICILFKAICVIFRHLTSRNDAPLDYGSSRTLAVKIKRPLKIGDKKAFQELLRSDAYFVVL